MDDDAKQEAEWQAMCRSEHGRVLTGRFRHWCVDWDGMTVDETTPEFDGCTCFSTEEIAAGLLKETPHG